jgi:beta-N-acetylhexosaminidase
MKKLFVLIFFLVTSHAAFSQGKPPFGQNSAWADSVLKTLSLQEKIGQMFVAFMNVSYEPIDGDNYIRIAALAESGKIGGLIFLKNTSPNATGDVFSVASLTNRLQTRAKVPLLFSADMEWGLTMRIPRGTEFPTNMALAATWSPTFAYQMGKTIALESKALGIHQNYAPDIDLNSNPKNPIINTRAFSENIDLTNSMAASFIRGTQDAGSIATVKHFPGHGDTDVDSHRGLPVLNFTRERLDSVELRPFKSAIAGGVMSVMVGHLAVPSIDGADNIPATLSTRITTSILKTDLGFRGLVVTDAMTMDGVKKRYATGEAALMAIQAGADIVLMSPSEADALYAVYQAVTGGTLSEARIDSSVRKILQLKAWLGLDKNRHVNLDSIPYIVGTKKNLALAQDIADKSVTLLRDTYHDLPLKSARGKIVNITLYDARNTNPDAGMGFHDALKARFPNVQTIKLTAESSPKEFVAAVKAASGAGSVVVSAYVNVRAWQGRLGLSDKENQLLKKLTPLLARKKIPLVLVAFGSPYIIMGHDKIPTFLTAYCKANVSEIAVAKILKGDLNPQGRLPITIPDCFDFGAGYSVAASEARK